MSDSAGVLSVDLKANDSASAVVRSFEGQLERTDRTATKTGRAIGDSLARGAQQGRSEFIALQQAVARNEAAAGNYAGAIQRLENLQNSFNQTNRQTLGVENQLIQTRNRAIAEIERQAQAQKQLTDSNNNLQNGFRGLQNVLGGLGLAFSAQQIVQFGLSAVQAANSLEKTQATARALSGSVSKYNELLKLATDGQRLYGGSLEKNIGGLAGLVNLSNRAGVELSSLDQIARRLSVVDPVQGIEGASYALKEFFSNNTASAAKSLIDRFELSPKLKEIAASGADAKTKLAALDAELNNLGITTDVLTNATNTQAATFDRLGAAADNAKVRVGNLLAALAQGPAQNLTKAFTLPGDAEAGRVDALQQAKNYDQYVAALQKLNQQLGISTDQRARMAAGQTQLTQAEFAFAQSLIASGTATDQAQQKALALRDVFAQLGPLQKALTANFDNAGGFNQLAEQITRVAAASPVAQANIRALNQMYLAGKINGDQYRAALNQLEAAQIRQANAAGLAAQREGERSAGTSASTSATQGSTAATNENNLSLGEQAQKSLEAAIQTQQLADFQATLANLGSQVANGLISAGNAALIMRAQYGVAADEAERLLRLQAALGQAKLNAEALSDQRAGERSGGKANSFKELQFQKDTERKLAQRARDDAAKQLQADLAIARAKKDTAREVALLRKQQEGLNKSSAEYKQIEAQIISAQTSGAKGGGSAKLSAAERLNNKLVDNAEATEGKITETEIAEQNKREDALRDYEQKRLEITEDFAEKRADAEAKFRQDFLEADASFYDTLINMEDQNVARQYDAEYQAALQNLPQIAAEKGADVADAYWSAYEEVQAARAKRAADIAKAERDGDAARAEALRGVDQKKRKAEDNRLNDTLNGKDSLQNQEAEAQAEAAKDYADKQEQIGNSSDRATDKIERNSQRRVEAIERDAAAADKAAKSHDNYNRAVSGETAPRTPPATRSTPTEAPATTTASTTPVTATSSESAIVQALAQVKNAVDEVASRVESLEKTTSSGLSTVASAAQSRAERIE